MKTQATRFASSLSISGRNSALAGLLSTLTLIACSCSVTPSNRMQAGSASAEGNTLDTQIKTAIDAKLSAAIERLEASIATTLKTAIESTTQTSTDVKGGDVKADTKGDRNVVGNTASVTIAGGSAVVFVMLFSVVAAWWFGYGRNRKQRIVNPEIAERWKRLENRFRPERFEEIGQAMENLNAEGEGE